jgi:hypothetical protein
MKHATSRGLYDHWDGLRRGRPAPERGDLPPTVLGSRLVEAFLLDLAAGTEPCYRFCGSEIAMRYGRDLAGEPFLLPFAARDRAILAERLAQLRVHAVGFVAGIAAETAGSGFSTYEFLLLPLRGARTWDGAIGSMARTGGHETRNAVAARIVAQSLRSLRVLGTDEALVLPPPAPGAALPPASGARRPHLVLVRGDG